MRSIRSLRQFDRDYKKAGKQGRNTDVLKSVIKTLASGEKLNQKYRDHKLSGEYQDCRECHVEADWLLIYQIEKDELVLIRTGSHSELFE